MIEKQNKNIIKQNIDKNIFNDQVNTIIEKRYTSRYIEYIFRKYVLKPFFNIFHIMTLNAFKNAKRNKYILNYIIIIIITQFISATPISTSSNLYNTQSEYQYMEDQKYFSSIYQNDNDKYNICKQLNNAHIISQDIYQTYLGSITYKQHANSIFSDRYVSNFLSIYNPDSIYGKYKAEDNIYSPYNIDTLYPPKIVDKNGKTILYLSIRQTKISTKTNKSKKIQTISPDTLRHLCHDMPNYYFKEYIDIPCEYMSDKQDNERILYTQR
jgi:hypothetical protein